MTSLAELGFIEGGVVEVLVSTVDREGKPNLAAMGAGLERGHVVLRPFKDTKTYSNLSSTKEAVLNLTDDPALFAYAALKLKCVEASFEPSKFVTPPRVKEAYGFVEVLVERSLDEGGRGRFECRPLVVEVRAEAKRAEAYCRAKPAVIEALVHASRLEAYVKHGLSVKELVKLIEHYRALVHRVAPKTRYAELIDEVWRWSEAKLRGLGVHGG